MTRIKQNTPNKPSYADEAFSKYGRTTSRSRKDTDGKVGRLGKRKEFKQRTDRHAEKPFKDGQSIGADE